MNKYLNVTKSIPATLTELIRIGNYAGKIQRIFVEIAVATAAIDQFVILAKTHESGSYHTLFSTAGDYTSPVGILLGTSGDLTAVASGSSGWFILDTLSLQDIQIKTASSSTASSVTAYISAAEAQ